MDDADLAGTLGEIRSKLDRLKALEAEHKFGVVIEDAPATLESIPEAPPGLVEVFRQFRKLEGTYFRFVQPDVIGSRAAWLGRTVNPHAPFGTPVPLGYEIMDVRPDADVPGGAPIYVDTDRGDVLYLDPDDYVWLYKNPDDEVDIERFAPDAVTFVNDYVLGELYPRLIEVVLGSHARNRRDRKGRYRDSWLRLLTAAGLAS